MKFVQLLILLVTLNCFSFAQTKTLPFHKDVVSGKLDNGLQYFILKNAKPEKRAELRLVVNVGSNSENENQQGLAHFLEHMAFNGTKNFKKSELVDYLESVGTKFGAHLNAYTSFDETVYMLQVPTDDPSIMEKGMQILEDWAHNLAFDSLEIEKERGVVIEEWRLRKGANDRMQAKYFPVLFKDSRYAQRLPIGKKEILENFKHDVLIDFYKTWYRPELMSVIVVGDINVKEVEKAIREKFSAIPASKKPKQHVNYPVPDHSETLICVTHDKEATNSIIQVAFKHDLLNNAKTVDELLPELNRNIYASILSDRLTELAKKSDSPILFSYAYFGNMVRTKANYSLFAMAKEGKEKEALQMLATENLRIRQHGIVQSELDRAKKSMLNDLERAFAEKDKTESSRLVRGLINYCLSGEIFMSAESELEIYKSLLNRVTLSDLNKLSTELIPDKKNTVIILQMPEKENLEIPKENEILSLWEKIKSIKTEAWKDDVHDGPLVAKTPMAGRVLEEKQIADYGITEWKLNNGAKIKFKKTNFKNDEILFAARSDGGSSLVSDEDYMSAAYATYILRESGLGDFSSSQLDKYLSDKTVRVSPFIYSTSEGFNGSCSPKNLETLFQLVYLYFTAPKMNKEDFETVIGKQKDFIANRKLNPTTAFYDSINCIMSGYDYRSLPITEERLSKVNMVNALKIYKQRFLTAADFTFYFVGNIDEAELKKYVELYLAGMPKSEGEKSKDLGVRPPQGVIKKEIKKGVEPKSNVSIYITGETKFSPQAEYEINALMKLLSIKLRESLREDKSGVYGVGAYGSLTKDPYEHFSITISFGCAPENVDMLIQAVYEEIEKIKKKGCDEKDLVKITETFRRDHETNEKENRYWLKTMMNFDQDNLPYKTMQLYMDLNNKLSSQQLKDAANLFLKMDQTATFILNPEN